MRTVKGLIGAMVLTVMLPLHALAEAEFKSVRTQFIAALGDPAARSGTGAEKWGLWKVDPGPRGVWLRLFPILNAAGGFAPSGWQFDPQDWWLDENGLLMEKPDFPVAAGRYVVTGDREVVTILTIDPPDENGAQAWSLEDGTLFDVTHLPCRSANYTPLEGQTCSPAKMDQRLFRVTPGAEMPALEGCAKQDYAVLFVIGIEKE